MRLLAFLTVVTVLLVAGCGEEGGGPPAARPPVSEQKPDQKSSKGREKPEERPLDVATFLERGAKQRTASVRGRLIPVGGRRLMLAAEDAAALVLAPPSFVRGIRRPGVPVEVTGSVRRLDRQRASQLDEQVSRLKRPTKRRRAARRKTIASVSRQEGDPYLVVRQVAPAPTPPRKLRELDNLERRRKK